MLYQVNIGDAFTLGEGQSGVASVAEYNSIGAFLSTVLPNAMVVANIILFFFILMGGFMMIANSGSPDKQAQGSKIMTTSLIGFLIIFGAYWIMQLLGYLTGYTFLQDLQSGL